MALCGMSGSLWRDALRNLARRLSWGLYSLCLGTSTGGSTGGERGPGEQDHRPACGAQRQCARLLSGLPAVDDSTASFGKLRR